MDTRGSQEDLEIMMSYGDHTRIVVYSETNDILEHPSCRLEYWSVEDKAKRPGKKRSAEQQHSTIWPSAFR